MKKLSFGILFSLLLSFSAFAGKKGSVGHFVGNAGEGIFYQDKVTLRDLYEANLFEFYIGTAIDPEISRRVDLLDNSVFQGVSKELLSRKLTDLNAVVPQLGLYVLETLRAYDLSLSTDKLGSADHDDPTRVLPEGAEMVTLANRYFNSIQFAKAYWDLMSAQDRVALLVHEGLYTLQFPYCVDGVCKQSAAQTRAMVAYLFTPLAYRSSLAAKEFKRLNITRTNDRCSIQRPQLSVRQFKDMNKDEGGEYMTLKDVENPVAQREFAAKVCQGKYPLQLESQFVRDGFILNSYSYVATGKFMQVAVTVIDRLNSASKFIVYPDQSYCQLWFEHYIYEWFKPESTFLGPAQSACQM